MSLYALFAFAALNQALRQGGNVTVLLTAVGLHAPAVVVGTLSALSSLLPMLFAVSIGRLNDRFGARAPMLAGSAITLATSVLPAVWPGLPALFVTATLSGLGSVCVSVSAQSVVGLFGRTEDRNRNFSWLSMSLSFGGILGPVVAGRMIDVTGYSGAFLLLAFLPVPALIGLGSGRLSIPAPRGVTRDAGRGGLLGAIDLLRHEDLRTVYLLTTLHVCAWEVFSFLVPLYGAGIGLAATSIGLILGAFSTATFLVRIVLPRIARRWAPLAIIKASLVLAGVLFVLFPLTVQVPLLIALALVLGMGLGVTQPLAMTVLHESAPDGRTGEAVGLRTAVINLSGTTMPFLYGALGTALGMLPVFWAMAAGIWGAVWYFRRA